VQTIAFDSNDMMLARSLYQIDIGLQYKWTKMIIVFDANGIDRKWSQTKQSLIFYQPPNDYCINNVNGKSLQQYLKTIEHSDF